MAALPDLAGEQLLATYQLSQRLQQLTESLQQGHATLLDLVEQLYTSWDEILVDMEISEGYEVEFYHTLKRVSLRLDPAGDSEPEPQEQTRRRKVSRVTYERHDKHLGLALRSKPPGVYDHEVETVPQPPGFAYMASPEQGSNRFGHWEQRGGTSFWHWYGQYAFMRSLFWGDSWRPIDRSDYRRYHDRRESGRTYYGGSGSRQRYGTGGTATTSRYRSSKYLRSGGYRNTRYVQSGGKFRGTKYTSSSSYRSSSYGFGSRSYGGK